MIDDRLASVGRKLHSSGPASAKALADLRPKGYPLDFLTFVSEFDGAEGWIGDEYVAIWEASDIVGNSETLDAQASVPGILLFGGDGGGETFGFDATVDGYPVVSVPLIPLSRDLAIRKGASFTDWILAMTEGPPGPTTGNHRAIGNVIYDVTPGAFGGNPADPKNKAVVKLNEALRMSRWWNDRWRVAQQSGKRRP